jgi:hypothetical protein
VKQLLSITLAVALVPLVASADDSDAMKKAAGEFYAIVLPDVTGIPNAAARARLKPTISPALDALLGEAAAAEDKFMTANKNAPPLVEGDLFSSLFEGVTSFTVSACSGDASSGSCTLALLYDDKSGKPVTWSDTLYLVNQAGGWRVDDVGYGGTWAFGNKGKLKDTLKWVITTVSQ